MRNFAVLRRIFSEKRFVCRNGILRSLIIVYVYFAAAIRGACCRHTGS